MMRKTIMLWILAAIVSCDSRVEVVERPQDEDERKATNEEDFDKFIEDEIERIKTKVDKNGEFNPEQATAPEEYHSELEKLKRKVLELEREQESTRKNKPNKAQMATPNQPSD